MKNPWLTAFIMFVAAFILFFSFQKDKNRINSAGKKILTSSVQSEVIKEEILAPKVEKATPPSADTGAEVMKPEPQEQQNTFSSNEVLDQFFKDMPKMQELQQLSDEELHETPQAVLDAGQKLAEIQEYFFSNPQTRDTEMSFYLKCSQQKDFFESVRAICAARLSQQYFEATGHEISAELFDKNIDNLRKEISL